MTVTEHVLGAAAFRMGYTTGTCAAAAAKAATALLCGGEARPEVEISLPNDERARLSIEAQRCDGTVAFASVRKDAGDDPDVTHRLLVEATVEFADGELVSFRAGPGVGTVTLPGLAVPPMEPAINPEPRRQILRAVREITERGLVVTLGIPGGEAVAERTFNPRLGIVGGLSILGTDGRVRPFSHERLVSALMVSLDVARAAGVVNLVLVPGHLGRRTALAMLHCPRVAVVEVANEFGRVLDGCRSRGFERVLLFGHPGKLAKLIAGELDTHSSRSGSALTVVERVASKIGIPLQPNLPTTEAVFASLNAEDRACLAHRVAFEIRHAVESRFPDFVIAVCLIDWEGNVLGADGDALPWTT
ncbi:MAG: cobalt-precorrin-5B (C(1))-methyltransferase CbiD [Polyangiaceae bacterium]